MANKLMTTLAIGAVGAAVGMMVTPNLDRRTQKAIKKATKRMMDAAGESMEWMK
ncbi:YtxH domain-containing protein [Clostridium sp. B9]|uniref:YtxH domain-containing protein n=1 Tax=Clostridium sp. B9 TaxID=3423224 RepID=UPI003D2F344F